MRRTAWLAILTLLALPAAARAKGPSLAEVISELTLPPQIQPGEAFPVAATIDVAAYCARTTSFAGPDCVANSTPGSSAELILSSTNAAPETSPRITDISGRLDRGADGVYRGILQTLPCQKEGAYAARVTEPNPALTAPQLVVASVAACTPDRAAPVVAAVRLPERLQLPDTVPLDNTGWTHGKLLVEIDDDASGALELSYQLTPADDPGTTYGGATVPCAPCGNRWTCGADIPLCGVAALGDLAVRVVQVTDRAGRQTAWWPPIENGPFAIVHCGGESAPDPVLACGGQADADAGLPTTSDAAATVDAGATTSPDAGVTDAQDAGTTKPDAPGVPEATPPAAMTAGPAGCAVASSPRIHGSAFLAFHALLGGILLTTARGRSRRPRR